MMVSKEINGELAIKWDNLSKLWYKFSRNKISVIGLGIAVLFVLCAIFAPFIAPYPEHSRAFVDFKNASLAPCANYWFGTDQYGRDILSRIIFAFRGALVTGVGVLTVAAPIGVFLGLIAGYYQGTWKEVCIMRVVDVFLSLPPLILALAVSAVLRPTLFNMMMAISLVWWAWYARISYSMASTLRNEYYVRSAELIGAGTFHILVREILPNCLGTVLTKMTLDMGWVILIGAALSFVGMGEQPPKAALGTMVADGARYLPCLWWFVVFPCIAIIAVVLSFNLLGDGIRDMLSTEEV